MAKKLGKPRVSESSERNIKLNTEKKKPGRRSNKIIGHSPKGLSISTPSINNRSEIVKKPLSRKSVHLESKIIPTVKKQEPSEHQEKSADKKSPKVESIKEKEDTNILVQQRFKNICDTVEQFKIEIMEKINRIQDGLKDSGNAAQSLKIDESFVNWIRKAISEEVSKEFNQQFDAFKETILATKLKKIGKLKRGRPIKIIRPTTVKIPDYEYQESTNQKKRGRKRKLIAGDTIEKWQMDDNLSPVVETIQENRRDDKTIDFATFNNLIERPQHKTLPNEPIEIQQSPKINKKIIVEIEEKPKQKPESSADLLPSVPLKSIQALIEDHKSDMVDTKKSISPETPVSNKSNKPPIKEQNKNYTSISKSKPANLVQDVELEFDFNAFSLNS